MGLINALNSKHTSFMAGSLPLLSSPLQATHEVGPEEPITTPLYDEGWVSPSKTHQGTQFDQGASISGTKQFPLRQYPIAGVNLEGQPAGCYWAHTPFSTSDLLNWKNPSPSYRDDPQRVADLFTSIFATHHPTQAGL